MAALQSASRVEAFQSETRETLSPVARLAMLHAEAHDMARLANLLGRSIYASVAIAIMAIAAFAPGGTGLLESLAWTVFMSVAVVASRSPIAARSASPSSAPRLNLFHRI